MPSSIIGVPIEVKPGEHRVGLTPGSVKELTLRGHQVVVQDNAGASIGFTNAMYQACGAQILASIEDVYAQAEMIVKVKEPQSQEYDLLREGQVLFTYLHLAPDLDQAKALVKSGCIAIAYETITDDHGGLPLLSPMSEVAGRLSVQAGAHCLEKQQGGNGTLLGGVPGVTSGQVVVIGGGVVGTNAIRMAIGHQARVTVLDRSLKRLRELESQFGSTIETLYATHDAVDNAIIEADLVIGAVLIPGATAPKLITRDHLSTMRPGSVLVDVSIDQGGCFEMSRATTHAEPIFQVDGINHYCVANMPGAVPRTSTFALNNATLSYVITLAEQGYQGAMMRNQHLRNGLNVCRGAVTHEAAARGLGVSYMPAEDALAC